MMSWVLDHVGPDHQSKQSRTLKRKNANFLGCRVRQSTEFYECPTKLNIGSNVTTTLSNGRTPNWYKPPPVLPIRFRLVFTKIGRRGRRTGLVTYSDRPRVDVVSRMLVEDHLRIRRSWNRGEYTDLLTRKLGYFKVPEGEQPAIIGRIFEVVDVAAVPGMIIDVKIKAEAEVVVEDYDDVINVDRDTREAIVMANTRRSRKKAQRAWAGCEYVAEVESASCSTFRAHSKLRTEECAVCMECLDVVPARKVDLQGRPPVATITRLPCLHHFHTHCILQWVKYRHTCPLCRFALPVANADADRWLQ